MSAVLRRAGLLVGMAALAACGEECLGPPEGTLGAPTAWEQAYLAGPGAPQTPAVQMLPGDDGLPLAYADWIPESWDGTGPMALLVHGSSAYGELYGVLGRGLSERGVLVRAIDVRGHGRSACPDPACGDREAERTYEDDGDYWPGRPGDSLDEDQIIRDLHLMAADLRQHYPAAPLWLAGHSSGAGVIARHVETAGMAELAGAVLLTPFLHPQQSHGTPETWDCGRATGSGYARVDMGALGDGRRGNTHRYVLSFHKDPEYTTALDTLFYSYTTVLGMAASGPDSFHAAFTRPVLWVAAEHDVLLDPERSREQFDRLAGGGAFVVARDTSHVGVSWSDAVADLMARFVHDPTAVTESELPPPS